MTTVDDQYWPRSALNSRYRLMPGEFMYKGNLWVNWTSEELIREVEEEFQFWPTDVLISGYPKCGNTLLSEVVSLLTRSQGQLSSWEDTLQWAHSHPVYTRVVFIEEIYQHIYPGYSQVQRPMQYLSRMRMTERPEHIRLLKTHLPADSVTCALNRIDEWPRIIYVYRNPKDTCVSMFHFYGGAVEYGPFTGDWDEFFRMWIDGWIAAGDWRRVVPEWLKYAQTSKAAGHPILCISYESLVNDPEHSLERVHAFLNPGKLLDPKVATAIQENTTFERMRDNPLTNYQNVEGFTPDFKFMRRGKIGDWKNWFTENQEAQFDEAYRQCVDQVNQLLFPEKLIFE